MIKITNRKTCLMDLQDFRPELAYTILTLSARYRPRGLGQKNIAKSEP